MKEVSLHKEDLVEILKFANKYETDYITINVDSSSGIGSLVKASLFAVVNGDPVTVTKDIVDESSW